MSTRRSLFTTGVLLSALVLVGSTAAFAQLTAGNVDITVEATGGYREISVRWITLDNKPLEDPNELDEIDGYDVRWMKGGAPDVISSSMADVGSSTSYTIKGLDDDELYFVEVRARGETDADPPEAVLTTWESAQASASTKKLIPAPQVRDLRLEAGDGMIMAMWDEVDDEPLGIHHYKVRVKAAGFESTMASDTNEHTITNLTNGTEYTVDIAAAGADPTGEAHEDRVGKYSDTEKATPGDGKMTETPALPLFGAFGLAAGLVAAGRRRLRRRQHLLNS